MRKLVPVLVLLLLIPAAASLEFNLRDSCQSDEVVLFSISNTTNAHAAGPEFYQDYTDTLGRDGKQVCADEIENARIVDECDNFANPVLSFYNASSGVTHLSPVDERHDFVLCSRNLATSVWRDCPSGSTPIVSIYGPVENHVARPGYYPYHVCGATFENATLAYEFTLSGNQTFIMNFQENPDRNIETTDNRTGYAAVQNQTVISGVVGGGDLPHTTGIRNDSGRAELNHSIHGGHEFQWFLPFTTGDYFDIENRLDLIQNDDFLNEFSPNFAFQLIEEILIQVTAELSDADLVNNLDLGPGFHTITIQHVGENAEGEPKIRLNVTRREEQ